MISCWLPGPDFLRLCSSTSCGLCGLVSDDQEFSLIWECSSQSGLTFLFFLDVGILSYSYIMPIVSAQYELIAVKYNSINMEENGRCFVLIMRCRVV